MYSIKEHVLPIAKLIYSDSNDEIIKYWEDILEECDSIDEFREKSISLTALCLCIDGVNGSIKSNNLNDVLDIISKKKHEIQEKLKPFIDKDLKTNAPKNEIIDEILSLDRAETGSSLFYYRLREAITLNLFELDKNVPTFKVQDKHVSHVAKILPNADENMILNNGEVGQWEILMSQAISTMDDYTADTFDVICILWTNTAKTKNHLLHFSHEDVLSFRNLQKKKAGNGSESYRKSDRIEVMRRLAALASIWISVNDDDEITFIERLDKQKDFLLSNYRRLFHIDNVTFAHDKKTNEAIGIYECDIQPSEFLANFLVGNKKTTSFLSLQALRYNPYNQKYHKRLTRYLSWQWRIRSKNGGIEKPFNVGGNNGLMKVIGQEPNFARASRTREIFENVLDTLADDLIIEKWHYVDIDESVVGTKGWLENYWVKLQVVIYVPKHIKAELFKSTSDILDYSKISEFGKTLHTTSEETDESIQLQFPFNFNESQITPVSVKHKRKKRGLSLNKAAEEIGIAHTTLSRYEKGLIKKPNAKNDEKIRQWLISN